MSSTGLSHSSKTKCGWTEIGPEDFPQILHPKRHAVFIKHRHGRYWYKLVPYDEAQLGLAPDLMIMDDPACPD